MTELDVVNMALAKLGQPVLEKDDYKGQQVKPARSCRLFFPQARESMLRRHPWSFALRRDTSTGVCRCGDRFEHGLPDDCLRVVELRLAGERKIDRFEIIGRELVCDHPCVVILYVEKEPDFDSWDSLFTECVVLKLASLLAGTLCQNPSLETDLLQKLEQVQFPKAITSDSQEVGSNENPRGGLGDLSKSMLLRARR